MTCNSCWCPPEIELRCGDDYTQAMGRAICFTEACGIVWPPAVTEVQIDIIENGCRPVLSVGGSFTPATQLNKARVCFDIPRATTKALACGVRRYDFAVRGLTPSGGVITLSSGWLSVR